MWTKLALELISFISNVRFASGMGF